MATTPDINDLLAWWQLDEASGNRADSHGSYTLTDNNTVGTAEGGADFNDANSETLYTNDTDLSWGDEPVTITGFVWMDDVGSNHGIVSRYGNSGNYQFLFRNRSGTAWDFIVSNNGTTTTLETNTTKNTTTGEWIFFAFYHDPTANTIGLRINADLQSMAHSTGLSDITTTSFCLGQAGGASAFHDGKIKAVNVWNAVLTSDELDWLYNSGTERTYSEFATEIDVPAGVLQVTGYAPVVSPLNIAVPLGALTVTGYAPTIFRGISVSVPLGEVVVTGYAPLINDETVLLRTSDGATLLGRVVDGDAVIVFSDGTDWYAFDLPKL